MMTKGQPTVILAKTVKGYGLGEVAEGRMTAHQQKKLTDADLMKIRDRFRLAAHRRDTASTSISSGPRKIRRR